MCSSRCGVGFAKLRRIDSRWRSTSPGVKPCICSLAACPLSPSLYDLRPLDRSLPRCPLFQWEKYVYRVGEGWNGLSISKSIAFAFKAMLIETLTKKKVRAVTPQQIASGILSQLKLPNDLRGRMVNLVKFPDEESCRAVYADRSLVDHEVACAYVKAEVRRRGGETSRTLISFSKTQWDRTEGAKRAAEYNHLVPASGIPSGDFSKRSEGELLHAR